MPPLFETLSAQIKQATILPGADQPSTIDQSTDQNWFEIFLLTQHGHQFFGDISCIDDIPYSVNDNIKWFS